MNFKLFGIPITVQPFFLLIMAFIGGGMSVLQSFTVEGLMKVVVFMIAGFISILIHELGHALMMKRYGRHPEIILHGLGGVAICSGGFTKSQNILVTLMGPVAQIVLGVIAGGIIFAIGGEESFPTGQSYHFMSSLAGVSIFWAVLNLIPIFPLDGGQLLSAVIGSRNQKAVHIAGIIIAGAIIIFLLPQATNYLFGIIILGMLIMDNVKAMNKYK